MNKVYKGTPISGPHLCESCQHATFIRGEGFKEFTNCGYTGRSVGFRVRQCSRYVHGGQADIVEMKKIAWVVETRNRGPWGFKGEGEREIVVRPPSAFPENMPTQGPE